VVLRLRTAKRTVHCEGEEVATRPERSHRKFDIKAKPVRWLGFFLDCRMNWRAHVKHRLGLGHHRMRTMAKIMTANGIRRKLARNVGRAVAMSIAAYGIEAI
jgi:hypothetical protein